MYVENVNAMEGSDDLKPGQVARLLNCSRQMVTKLARTGELEGAYGLGRVLRVPRASVDAYKARRAVAAPQPRLTTQATDIVTT